MKRFFSVLAALACAALPLAALAQDVPPPGEGPPPAVRAQMETLRTQTRTSALASLTPMHRDAVQAIIAQVTAGKLTDLRDAAKQIDGALTPDETKAVLATREQMHAAMVAAMGTPPPGAPPMQGPPPERRREGKRMNDAGFYLLQLSLTREQMRALMPRRPQP